MRLYLYTESMQRSQTWIATPVNALYLSLPLPSRERTEVRGSFDKLRMTSLFAMVSSHREPVERRTITLTPTLSG